MKKGAAVLIFTLFCAGALSAQDKLGWELDLKRVSLNLSNTSVRHSDRYQGFPSSKLTADDQTLLQGQFDLLGSYYADKYVWTNELFSEYGRTKVEKADGEKTVTENADQILLTTDFAYRAWSQDRFLGGFDFGPFVNAGFETEFTARGESSRRKILRGKLGLKLFEGKYIDSFYAALVGEDDMTYSPGSAKLAWETGLELRHELREGVKASFKGMFRDYLSESKEYATDIDYEMSADARLDVLVLKNLSVAPFISYYAAQAKHFSGLGQNIYIGVSFSFSRTFISAGGK